MMDDFLKILFSLSISGTLLLLLTLLLKQIYRNKLGKGWQYYIWLAVALRFLLPFTPDAAVSGRLVEAAASASLEENAGRTKAFIDLAAPKAEKEGADFTGAGRDGAGGALNLSDTVKNPISLAQFLFFVWAAGVIAFLIHKITVYQSFMRFVRAGNTEETNIGILDILARCEENRKVRRRIGLYRNPLIASPIMTGFFRPGIILPDVKTPEEDLIYIFDHELIHYKRRDLLYKWFAQLVICVHWFNPFVYRLGKEINRACELSCDEALICTLDEDGKRAYGDLLISSVKTHRVFTSHLASVTLSEGAEQLKERLGAIMDYKKKSKVAVVFTALCTGLICICSSTLGAYAKQNPSAANPAVSVSGTADSINQLWEDNRILFDSGVYYILSGGASAKDRPSTSVTEGYTAVVLVKKEGYVSLGPFSNDKNLSEEVARQCGMMLEKGHITQEDASVLSKASEKIQNQTVSESEEISRTQTKSNTFTYIQRGFYQNPYIIEMGWNSDERESQTYIEREIAMGGNFHMTVRFAEQAEEYADNTNALAAINELIASLKAAGTGPEIEKPLIISMTPVSLDEIPAKAEEYFNRNEVMKFSALFPVLDDTAREEFIKRSYEDDKIALFAAILEDMDEALALQYAVRSEQDNKINFFSVLLDKISPADFNNFAERSYAAGQVALFSILVDEMKDQDKQNWLTRAQRDKKSAFIAVIAEEL